VHYTQETMNFYSSGMGNIKNAEQWTIIQQYGDWYTGR